MTQSANPQPLPERPNLEQLRKQAKELHTAGEFSTLTAAQHALARRYGFPSWPTLKLVVESKTLRHLIQERDVNGVKELLGASPKVASTSFTDGSTPLHAAVEANSPEIVTELVAAGAPFDKKYASSSHTALSWAITVGAFNAAIKLVELGNEPGSFLRFRSRPLEERPGVLGRWQASTQSKHNRKFSIFRCRGASSLPSYSPGRRCLGRPLHRLPFRAAGRRTLVAGSRGGSKLARLHWRFVPGLGRVFGKHRIVWPSACAWRIRRVAGL